MRSRFEPFTLAPQVAQWLGISLIVGLLAGTASAGFLAALEWATDWRESHRWIIALLPAGGFFVGWLYHRYGSSVERGNNQILEEIHDPKRVIPLRMTPLVLLGTVATHFFGGSAGREGTAVQMGGSLADQLTRLFRMRAEQRRILLMAGMSAGFASVFGTPLAGAVFGLEVLAIGKMRYDAIFPCFASAIVADQVTTMWGVGHTHYVISSFPQLTLWGLLAAVAAGVAFGTVGMLFARTTHVVGDRFKALIRYAPLRPAAGGIILALAVAALGSTRYVGLGIPVILEAFDTPLPAWDFAAKLLFTAVTLGAGFKGGEVTPLFFIGATLGSTLSWILPLPTPLLAGMGFVAVFAGASNTPLASTLMAIELFGAQAGVYAGIACVVAYLFSGHAGIYRAQRIGLAKGPGAHGIRPASHATGREPQPAAHPAPVSRVAPATGQAVEEQDADLWVMRLYCRHGARVRGGAWHARLLAPTLATHLAKLAHAAGIRQAVMQPVAGGYLAGDRMFVGNLTEIPSAGLPQCVELVDTKQRLRSFRDANAALLEGVTVTFFRSEADGRDAVLDRAPAAPADGV